MVVAWRNLPDRDGIVGHGFHSASDLSGWTGPVQGTLPDRQGNTEAELSAIDVPELDDAVEAVRILNDLSDSWKGANPGQRNRLLLAIFHGNYVDLGNREAWVCDP